MKTFKVKVWQGVTQHVVTVRARSLEESMEEALRVLKLTHKNVERMESEEQA